MTDKHALLIQQVLEQLSRMMAEITIFQMEHRLFANEFYFNEQEYREALRNKGEVLGGFYL